MPNSRHCSFDLFNKSTPNTGAGEYVFYVRVEKLHYGIHPSTSATLGQRQCCNTGAIWPHKSHVSSVRIQIFTIFLIFYIFNILYFKYRVLYIFNNIIYF